MDERQEKSELARLASSAGLVCLGMGGFLALASKVMGVSEFNVHIAFSLVLGLLLALGPKVDPISMLGRIGLEGLRGLGRAAAHPSQASSEAVSFLDRFGKYGELVVFLGVGLVICGLAGAAIVSADPSNRGPLVVSLLVGTAIGLPLMGGSLIRLVRNWLDRRARLEARDQSHLLEARADFERFSMQGPPPDEDDREAVRRERERKPLAGGTA